MNKQPDKKYHLSFIEEAILNEACQDWTGGRVEVFIDSETYNIEEIRFLTLRNKEWEEFREKYDGENVNEQMLKEIRNIVKRDFSNTPIKK